MTACSHQPTLKAEGGETSFNYVVDQFADLQVLRYQVPGFEELSLRQKQLLYHLSEAALMGRDILADQNCRYNLPIRRTLEAVYTSYKGNREDEQFKALETYLKRVWFSNGIHHHYAEDKILPTFSPEFFADCVRQVEPAKLPLREGETVDQLLAELSPVIFDPTVLSKRTVQSGDVDLIQASANNYYEGDLTQAEVDASGQPNARLGGLKYADLNNSGTIDSNDQDWIFNPVPKFSYGINIGLTYKDFDLSMFWQGVCGQDVYNNQKAQTDFWAITDAGQNKGSRLLDAWNTNNTGSDIPRLSTRNSADEGRMSSYYVENGSYIKLRSLQLGYTLPKEVASKLLMTSARVYVSGQNLLTVKSQSLTCPDPENPNWNYPIATSVSFGLQLSF